MWFWRFSVRELPYESYKLSQLKKLTLFENPLPIELAFLKLVNQPAKIINRLNRQMLMQNLEKEKRYNLITNIIGTGLITVFIIIMLFFLAG